MKTINGFRSILVWVLALIALSLISLWVFLISKSYSYRTEINSVNVEISSNENHNSYLNSIHNVLRGTEGSLEVIEGRFIKENDVPIFIKFLEGEADAFKVKADLSGINLDPATKNSLFRILHVRINGSGSWADLISFVHALDTSNYEAHIDSVNFSNSKSSWNIVMDISQYVQ